MAVVLYCMPLKDLNEEWEEALLARLPWEEQKRINALENKDKKVESLYAWSLLAHLLFCEFGMAVMPRIARSDMGKPFLPEFVTTHISLSHAEGIVMAGAAWAPVGVDVEKIRPVPARAGGLFGENKGEEDFWQKWTVAESRLKLRGRGVGAVRNELEMLEGEHWQNVEILPGYAAAAAWCGNDEVQVRTVSPKELYW